MRALVTLDDIELHDPSGTLVAVGRDLFASPTVAP